MPGKPRLWLLLLLLGVLALGGCMALPDVAPEAPATPMLPLASTPTPEPTSSPTNTPTALPATTTSTPTPEPTSTPTPTPRAWPDGVALETFVTLPDEITYLTHAGDGSGRIFIVEKDGRVRIVDEDGVLLSEPFLDIRDKVRAGASEQGLLSIAFAPDYVTSGVLYVNYTAQDDGATVVARYRVSENPDRADLASEQILLRIAQPAPNHNGGQLQFGPDGYLYIGTGDGGRAGDPWDNAENLESLLGKILRIDVSGDGDYRIPADNPFAAGGGAPEIWAYGLRNPWRFSFDALTGDLYIGDVGQGDWEEVDFQATGDAGGQHYGWNTMEGTQCYDPAEDCDPSGKTPPIFEYPHDTDCSITGGYVYRGQAHPDLQGIYVFGDYCSGRIRGLQRDTSGVWLSTELFDSDVGIASFGVDERGELYVLDLGGEVYRLIVANE